MDRKIIGIAICTLFLGASVVSSINIQLKEINKSKRGDILYVGGDGDGNYSTINEALVNASDGDTVFVYALSSPYLETLLIDKSIKLIGEDKETTIINGSQGLSDKYVIKITADNVTVTDFTITGGLDEGILLYYSNWSIVTSNIIKSTVHHAIWIQYSENNSILSNFIKDNYDSIDFEYSHNNNIISNQILSNSYRGMTLGYSNLNTFTDNTLISNGLYGISFAQSSNNNIFYKNTIMDNIDRDGIRIDDSSSNNLIYCNNIINNSQNAEDYSNNDWNSTFIIDYFYNGNCYSNYMGNYWDDYTGLDTDGDGIGDTSYDIGSNSDLYPLIVPFEYYFNNPPPLPPLIDGSTCGKPNIVYSFSFNSTDPEGAPIKFFVDWDDNNTEWTDNNDSGVEITLEHYWSEIGDYIIKAKAIDNCGAESEWSEFPVTIPRDKNINTINRTLLQFLQSHPYIFPLLQKILQQLVL